MDTRDPSCWESSLEEMHVVGLHLMTSGLIIIIRFLTKIDNIWSGGLQM